MALPSFYYKNPMDVLDQKQQSALKRSCVGCAHAFEIMFNSGPAMGCNKGKLYGKRCILFQEVK